MADEVTRLRRSLGDGDGEPVSPVAAPSASCVHKYVIALVVATCIIGFVHRTRQSRVHPDHDPLFQPF